MVLRSYRRFYHSSQLQHNRTLLPYYLITLIQLSVGDEPCYLMKDTLINQYYTIGVENMNHY
jgi:hypothetical protein